MISSHISPLLPFFRNPHRNLYFLSDAHIYKPCSQIPFLEMGYSLIEIDEEYVEYSYNNRNMLKRNISIHNLFFRGQMMDRVSWPVLQQVPWKKWLLIWPLHKAEICRCSRDEEAMAFQICFCLCPMRPFLVLPEILIQLLTS